MKNTVIIAWLFLMTSNFASAQKIMGVEEIIRAIDSSNPVAKMYEAQIRSMDEAAKGARSWMPTEFGTGLWMAPYNTSLWKKGADGTPGMGQYMISVQQMFPNKKKQDAEEAYMKGMSAADKERKKYDLNQLYAAAKKNFYSWLFIKKKISLLDENKSLLDLMIKDAEIRYRNSLDRMSAYYKAKAAVGNNMNTRIALENEAAQKRIQLNTFMNRDKYVPFDIDTAFSIKGFSASSVDTNYLINRSDIRAIDRDIALTALQQVAEKQKTKPEFGIRYENMFGFGGLPMQYTLMGMARIPIGKANRMPKANIASLKWKSEALTKQKEMLLNESSGMAAGTIGEYNSKKRQVALYEENILPAVRKNYQVTQSGYQQNTEQLPALFEAWDTLNKASLEHLELVQQLMDLRVELERIFEIR